MSLIGCTTGGKSQTLARVLQNPGFDLPASGSSVPGWISRGDRYARATLVSEPVVSGPRALELVVRSPGSSGESSFMLYQQLDPVSHAGRRLSFEAKVWTDGAGINLVLYTPQKSVNDFVSDVHTKGWVTRSGFLDVPADATFLSFGIQVLGPAGSRAWVDDVLVEAAGRQAARPQAQAAAPPATVGDRVAAGRVEIDAGRIVRTLSPLIFGMHIEWVARGNGLVTDRGVLRTEVVDALKEVRIPLFRFPGGIHADYYDWHLGAGTPQDRGQSKNVFTGEVERHVFGTPELSALAKAIGAEVLITANYGTGTPALAGAWAGDLQRQGVPARYWEVGNEIYLSDPRSDAPNGRAIYHSPEQYAGDFPQYRAAIQSAIPGALVGAIAHLDTGAFPLAPAANPDWTSRMLQALGTKADFFAVHNAYAPVLLDDQPAFTNGAVRSRTYRSLYAASLQTADNLEKMAEIISRLSPPNREPRFAVTEFGPFFGISRKTEVHATYVDQTRTLAAALYTASVLDVLIGNPRVFLSCYTNPIHRWYGSLLTDTDGGLIKTPTDYLYGFYRTRFEPRLVQTQVSSPVFDADALGIVKARRGVPDLIARSSLSDDGRRLTAILVNRSVDRELLTRITIKGFKPVSVDCQLLSALSPSARNGPGLTNSTQTDRVEIAPRSCNCAASDNIDVQIPPNAVMSLVAKK